MMNLDQAIARLQGCKNSKVWDAVAKDSGISYDTVARIARGFIKNPGIRTVEAIEASLDKHQVTAPAPG